MIPEAPANSDKLVNLADYEVSIEAEPQSVVYEVDHDAIGSKAVRETFLECPKSMRSGEDPEELNAENAQIKNMNRLHVVLELQGSFDQQNAHEKTEGNSTCQ